MTQILGRHCSVPAERPVHGRAVLKSGLTHGRTAPHPGPLPVGEGTTHPVSFEKLPFPVAERAGCDSPSPGGEGRGEGLPGTLQPPWVHGAGFTLIGLQSSIPPGSGDGLVPVLAINCQAILTLTPKPANKE